MLEDSLDERMLRPGVQKKLTKDFRGYLSNGRLMVFQNDSHGYVGTFTIEQAAQILAMFQPDDETATFQSYVEYMATVLRDRITSPPRRRSGPAGYLIGESEGIRKAYDKLRSLPGYVTGVRGEVVGSTSEARDDETRSAAASADGEAAEGGPGER